MIFNFFLDLKLSLFYFFNHYFLSILLNVIEYCLPFYIEKLLKVFKNKGFDFCKFFGYFEVGYPNFMFSCFNSILFASFVLLIHYFFFNSTFFLEQLFLLISTVLSKIMQL